MPLPETPLYPVRVRLAVLWGEMDALGHVNNLACLRWFEEARLRYLVRVGLGDESGRVGVILARQQCDYLAPLTYPDEIEVRVSTTKLGRSSFTLAFAVRSERLGADAARGEGSLVVFDYAMRRSVPMPEETRARIEAVEGGE
jgi:acyl-CoA thioester hydrolase